MMRQPKSSEVPEIKANREGIITQVREYELITPLFGGGVTPAEADPVTVVRGTEVRGHLRFWWRATQGGRFNGDLAAMKEAEDNLWGAAASEHVRGPSRVQVVVTVTNEGTLDRPFEVGQNRRPSSRNGSVVPGYAAFPLQPPQNEAKPGMQTKSVRAGVVFDLKIDFPFENRKEIEATLWAWETFGGLGARTRRGFGALRCMKVDGKEHSLLSTNRVEQQIRQAMQNYVSSGKWPNHVAHLSQTPGHNLKVAGRGRDAVTAWQTLIKKLQRFRQNRDGNRGFGLSSWPEPNAIRSLVGKPIKGNRTLVNKFPRARFGLPVVFHMPHDSGIDDLSLQGTEFDRLASPLILRPLACADGAVGLALILVAPQEPLNGLILKGASGKSSVQANLTTSEARNIPPLNGETDVLKKFLDTL